MGCLPTMGAKMDRGMEHLSGQTQSEFRSDITRLRENGGLISRLTTVLVYDFVLLLKAFYVYIIAGDDLNIA